MDPLTALMMGSTALSGISSLVGGNRSAKAANDASQQKFGMQLQGIKNAEIGGAQYRGDLYDIAQAYDPYVTQGRGASNALYGLLGLNGQGGYDQARAGFDMTRGDFLMDQGVQALDRSAAARGQLNSGRQSKDLTRFGQGLASQDMDKYIANLTGFGNQGYSATGARAGLQAQGEGGELQGALAAAGMYGAAGDTLAQGRIGAATAQNQGINGALGAMNYGVGQMNAGGQNPLQSLLGNTSRGSSFGGGGGSTFLPSASFLDHGFGFG
jgi:hypothetical protein